MKIILLFLIMVMAPYSVFSAELVEGERDGKIKLQGQEFVPATFIVRSIKKDDELIYKIEMIHDDRLYSFDKLTFDSKKMEFALDTGQKYNCVLSMDEKVKNGIKECKDKKGYCGECIHLADDGKQKLIIINMKPPSEQPEPSVGAEGESRD
jgi:hypothetical protein